MMDYVWDSTWQDHLDSEPNRYLDWDKTTGGIQPSLRGDARALLKFGRIDDAAFRSGTAKAPAADPKLQEQKKPEEAVPLTSEEYQKCLVLLLILAIKRTAKTINDAQRLPPLPKGSLTVCPNIGTGSGAGGTSPDDVDPDISCYFDHIREQLALPCALMPSLSTPPAGYECDLTTPFPSDLHLRRDSVIAGVLDVGLPLGHRSTRDKDGKTRILAAWQQAADRSEFNKGPVGKTNQYYLPFGREYLADEINTTLTEHSTNNDIKDGHLDEEAFNRDLDLESYNNPFGQRDLGLQASHGAHVLDTFAGADPDETLAERTRIIAVNLPDRSLVGHSAQFLEYFAVHGILRIVMLADALWDKLYPKSKKGEKKGFPIVINLSFGKQATSRDGLDLITEIIEILNKLRCKQGRPDIILIAPAGNENLDRGNVRATLRVGAMVEFDWRVLPDDQSANFVEIWAGPHKIESDEQSPLEIQVVPPGGPPSPWAGGEAEQVLDLRSTKTFAAPSGSNDIKRDLAARIYSDRPSIQSQIAKQFKAEGPSFVGKAVPDVAPKGAINAPTGNDDRKRLHYLIAAKQTLLFDPSATAPSGLWRIRLKNASNAPMRVDINVQTDQTEQPLAVVNQRSYFERPEYERFDETGRIIDSYSYPYDGKATSPRPTDVSNLLRRHGTINGLGHSKHTVLAAGHRVTDGRMMPFSATGLARLGRRGANKDDAKTMKSGPGRSAGAAPLASLPVREGAGHFGRLSAGSRDGFAVAMEGTSFAASQLSRIALEKFIAFPKLSGEKIIQKLRALADAEENSNNHPGKVSYLKAGEGRMNGVTRFKVANRR